jgi:toxin ParE1/3/4
MKVYWTNTAIARLRGIEQVIAQDSPLVAPRVVARILRSTNRLEALPHSGRTVSEYDDADIREILLRPYRIIYLLKPGNIYVLTVRHYRELLPDDIANLREP